MRLYGPGAALPPLAASGAMPRRTDKALIRVVGQRIRALRDARDISQQQLAEQVGLQPQALSRVETGARGLSLANLVLIAEALGVPLGELVDPDRPESEASLSDQERELVARFREVPKDRRALGLRLVRELSGD